MIFSLFIFRAQHRMVSGFFATFVPINESGRVRRIEREQRMFYYHIKPFGELTVEELHRVTALREQVFYIEQRVTTLDADVRDPASTFLWVESEGEIVAFLRLIPPGVAYAEASIGRVCVAATHRRRGICREMMRRATDYMTLEWSVETIRISAQSYLVPFYESLRFGVVSEEYLEAGIPHKKMLWTLEG